MTHNSPHPSLPGTEVFPKKWDIQCKNWQPWANQNDHPAFDDKNCPFVITCILGPTELGLFRHKATLLV